MNDKPLNLKQIRELASTTGVPTAQVYGPARLHPSTCHHLYKLGLQGAPWGSAFYKLPLLFTEERAWALQPDSKGKRLAARFNDSCGGRFVPKMGIYTASWQWYPERYKDENGVPNSLVVTGDGFPMARLRLGADEVWRWDWVQNPDVLKQVCGSDFEHLPASHKEWVALDKRVLLPQALKALGLPPETDPATLMGQPVSEDAFIDATFIGTRLA